jgi:hypothetical protein
MTKLLIIMTRLIDEIETDEIDDQESYEQLRGLTCDLVLDILETRGDYKFVIWWVGILIVDMVNKMVPCSDADPSISMKTMLSNRPKCCRLLLQAQLRFGNQDDEDFNANVFNSILRVRRVLRFIGQDPPEELAEEDVIMDDGNPNAFKCPITRNIMDDPVMLCDGYSYERKAISIWLQEYDISPITGDTLRRGKTLIPNISLKSAIEERHNNGHHL